jgi:hypothetical protein
VSLVFDDGGLQLGQFGDLKACRRGIVRLRRGRQGLLALLAVAGDKGLGLANALGRQELLEMRRMARLCPALALARLAGRRLGGVAWLARGPGFGEILVLKFARQIEDEVCLLPHLGFQLGKPGFELGNVSVALATSLTRRSSHAAMLATHSAYSCASLA